MACSSSLKNGYIYFHEVATLPHFASSSLPSPTVGHVGACNKALARFLWFEPSRFRQSKPLTLRAGRQKSAIPTPNSEVQDCKPWQPAATGWTEEFNSYFPHIKWNRKTGRWGWWRKASSKSPSEELNWPSSWKQESWFPMYIFVEFSIFFFFCTEKGRLIELLHYWVFCQHWFSLALLRSGSKKHHRVFPASHPNQGFFQLNSTAF